MKNAAAPPAAKAQGKPKAEPQLSVYEMKRLEKMAQNAQFLQQLGIKRLQANGVAGGLQKTPERKPVIKRSEQPPAPMRRSKRLRGGAVSPTAAASSASLSQRTEDDSTVDDAAIALELQYNESSVYRYTCETKPFKPNDPSVKIAPQAPPAPSTPAVAAAGEEQPSAPAERSLAGFRFSSDRLVMQDPQLKKIYSISFSPFEENRLIATGGHQGQVSIYGSSPVADPESQVAAPLMSFRAHKGWISSVSLAKSSATEGRATRNVLITTSNDSFLKVWDLNQSSTTLQTPKEVLKINSLHQNGIFGLDVLGDALLTCSKDASIVLSTFRDDGSDVSVVHRFHDHTSVVKCVRFSPLHAEQFASGGNDRALRVFDTRFPNTAALEIGNAHTRAINSVQWHPTQEHWLLSASFDPDLHLFDLRKPSLPLFTFHGHYLDNQQNAIYHPVFVDNGNAIVAAGGSRCQEVSLYKTNDGSTISRGFIGMKADYIAAEPFHDRILIASNGSLQFCEYEWQR